MTSFNQLRKRKLRVTFYFPQNSKFVSNIMFFYVMLTFMTLYVILFHFMPFYHFRQSSFFSWTATRGLASIDVWAAAGRAIASRSWKLDSSDIIETPCPSSNTLINWEASKGLTPIGACLTFLKKSRKCSLHIRHKLSANTVTQKISEYFCLTFRY